MKTVNKKLLAVAVAGVLGMGSVSVMADDGVSANVGFVSDYVWRGDTQNSHKPAIQGGFDYAKGPMSVGIWGSSVGTGAEVDLYGSYNFGPVAVGAIYYAYPSQSGSDFYEINIGGDVGPVSLMYSYNPDGGADYIEAGYSFEMTKGVSLDLHAGKAKSADADYSIGVSGSAGGFDLGLTYASKTEGSTFVSVSKSM